MAANVPLTGGEKYNIKQLLILIKDRYPLIQNLTSEENYTADNKKLGQLYDLTLEIFTAISQRMTTNLIFSNNTFKQEFEELQEVHSYKTVKRETVENLKKAIELLPSFQEELISLVDNDTSNRDDVLRQIMKELNIKDPNEKKSNKWFS